MDELRQIKGYSQFVKVGINWVVYSSDQNVSSDCNAIYFRNQGTSAVTINSKLILQAGQDWYFTCHPGEFFEYDFYIAFASGGNNNLFVAWKTP